MDQPLLDIRDVRKSYGATPVLDGLSLTVAAHEVVCLIGPSGCGKSTLLRCVNGLEGISGGEILLAGDRISGPGVDLPAVRRRVGIVFQGYNLFPHMSVLDNICLAPVRALGLSRRAAADRALALLSRIGLEARARDYPDRLSGGQQQRVAIVRALAMDPLLLLLDEVTSALDPELVQEVLALAKELSGEGMTMVLATHEMGFARDVADRVCFLHQGRVHEQGSPAQVLGNPQRPRTRAFLERVLG